MRRRLPAIAAGIAVAAIGAALWSRWHGAPRVIEPGEPVPSGETVDLRFDDETWKLSKRETTREESLRGADLSRALPEPDPADPERGANESARVLDDMARDAWLSGDVEGAMDLFEQAVAADPDDWVPRAHLGRLLTAAHDHAGAREQLERAAALAPDDPQRWLDLQTLYERTLDLDLAFEARRRAEALAPGRPIAKDWAGFWMVEGAEAVP